MDDTTTAGVSRLRGTKAETPNDYDLKVVYNAARRLGPITPDDYQELVPHITVCTLPARAYFLRSGEVAATAGVAIHGVLREFRELPDGAERTRWFSTEGSAVGALSDLLTGARSESSIQALTTSRVAVAPWSAFVDLRRRSFAWAEVAINMVAVRYMANAEREWELMSLGAEERYRKFCERWPDLDERVSQRVVASYLGITREHLNRIRAGAGRKVASR